MSKEHIIKDLSRTLNERISREIGTVCQLCDTDEEKMAILIVALNSLFAATGMIIADVLPAYKRMDPTSQVFMLNSILAQGQLDEDEIRRPPFVHPHFATVMAQISNALQRTTA